MSAAEDIRFLHFEDPRAFLEATKRFDDYSMRFCLGSQYEYVSKLPPSGSATDSPTPVYLFTIYRGDDLLIALSHNSTDYAWMLSIPSSAEHLVMGTPTTPGLLAPAISLLASSTLVRLSPNPLVLSRMVGYDAAVNAFLAVWSDLLASRGLRIRIRDRPGALFNGCRVSYSTRASLPPPLSPPFSHPVVQASTAEDLEGDVQLYTAFQQDEPWCRVVSREDAIATLEEPVKAGLVWYVRVDGEPAGYAWMGRTTPRTLAIRNVFVSSSHRRKGIAEAMVRGVTRYYLDVPPHGVQPIKDCPPTIGVKEEVHLNVFVESAERIYMRSGFLFPDKTGDVVVGGFDPITGRKSWFTLAAREVELESEPESSHEQSC